MHRRDSQSNLIRFHIRNSLVNLLLLDIRPARWNLSGTGLDILTDHWLRIRLLILLLYVNVVQLRLLLILSIWMLLVLNIPWILLLELLIRLLLRNLMRVHFICVQFRQLLVCCISRRSLQKSETLTFNKWSQKVGWLPEVAHELAVPAQDNIAEPARAVAPEPDDNQPEVGNQLEDGPVGLDGLAGKPAEELDWDGNLPG